MKIRNTVPLATATVLLASVVPGVASNGERVQPTNQSVGDTSRIVDPTWKTYSTTVGRGTKINVSTGGNITSFASPNEAKGSYEHIGVGAIGEGYVLCYNGGSPAYDLGESSSGWAAPTTTSSAVTRNTLDGKITMIQNFNLMVGTSTVPTFFTVQMTLVNRTSQTLNNVVLRRQVDFDIDTGGTAGWAGFLSNHTRTKGTVSAFHDPVEAPTGKESHGIMMMVMQSGGKWETRVTNSILDSTCNPTPAPLGASFVARGDYGDTMIFPIGSIPGGGSKTVSLRYMRY